MLPQFYAMIKSWIKRHPKRIYFSFFALVFLISCLGIIAAIWSSLLERRDRKNEKVAREVLTDLLQNQSQQLFHYNRFTDNLDALYRTTSEGRPGYNFAMNVNENLVLINAIPTNSRLPNFAGAVFIIPGDNLIQTVAGMCKSQDKLSAPIQLSRGNSPVVECPDDSELIISLASALLAVTDENVTQNFGGVCLVDHSSNQLRKPPRADAIAPPETGENRIKCPAGSSLKKSWVIPVSQ